MGKKGTIREEPLELLKMSDRLMDIMRGDHL